MPVSGGTQFLKPQELIAKLSITEGMHVADLGCGNLGYFIIPIAKLLGKEGKAYAVDVLKPVLEAVRSRAKLEGITNLETVWTNLEKVGSTPIPEASLDLALIINMLFQNKNHKEILKEANRLLKKGANLVVVDWKKIAIPLGPAVEMRLDPGEVKKMGSELNLQVIEEIELGDYFWGIIFVKN